RPARSRRACPVGLGRHEPMELALACPLWMEDDRLLAGPRAHCSLPPPLRWIRRSPRPPRLFWSPRKGTLGADDARGTRKIPPWDEDLLERRPSLGFESNCLNVNAAMAAEPARSGP